MEPIAQVSQALQVIENVCKISSMVWVNKNQCKRIADRFRVIAEGLKGMELDKHPAGGSSNKDYPGFDELLTVLRKGEVLVSYYTVSAVSRTDNREAFLEIHQELDTLDSQFHFEGLDGKYIRLASGIDGSALLTEDAEKDLKEMPRKLEELARINEDPMHTSQEKPDLDLETWQQVVSEKSKPVGEDGKLPIYLSIDWSTVETKAPVRELVRQSTQDPTDKELVGFGQDSERAVFLKEKLDADLRNFMKKKLEPAPGAKPRPVTRSEELDIITQIAKGMHYLHTQQYVPKDLNCANVLVKKSGDYLDVKIADPRNAMKRAFERPPRNSLGGPWDQAAFEVARSTKRPRWTAPEAIKLVGGVRPSPDLLRKSDVYSFAMTCYEVVTGKLPFDGIKDNALPEQIEADGGYRPTLPSDLYPDLKVLIEKCWHGDPEQRPDFSYISEELRRIQQAPKSLQVTSVIDESVFEQGNVLKHSCDEDLKEDGDANRSRDFGDSGAPEMNLNSPSLIQQRSTDIFIGPEMPEAGFGVNPSTLYDDEPPMQTRHWSAEESRAVLELTEEALRVDVGLDSWDFVSEKLFKQYDFDRASKSCQKQWNTLLKSFYAIRDHESFSCVTYWEMDEDLRSKNNLSRVFDLEWCKVIERILTAKSFDEETSSIQMDADLRSFVDLELEEGDTQSEDKGLSADSTATLESQAALFSNLASTQYNQQQPGDEISSMPDKDLFSRISRFVKKQIEDALEPLFAVVQSRKEEEQKRRDVC
jgi:serine/threonine protein kinase